MDLCTVLNKKFVKSTINLIKSYKHYSYNKKIYVYYFGSEKEDFKELESIHNVMLIAVPNNLEHAWNPRGFYYKLFALSDCSLRSDSFIYSDATNCFISDATKIHKDMEDGCLFLPYPYEKLTNQYWTTKKCFDKIEGSYGSEFMPQYWAAFQLYDMTDSNKRMIQEMHGLAKDVEVCLPDPTVKHPDGAGSKCIEHRQDQSILSILIHKYDKHQKFDLIKNNKYGDWQTMMDFDKTYIHKSENVILSSRESKFGNYRFI
jgi:hypothetical protein